MNTTTTAQRLPAHNGASAVLQATRFALTGTLLALVLAGCASLPDGSARAQFRAPGSISAAAAVQATVRHDVDWPRDAWWTRYGDNQLSALIDEALRASPTMRAAQARVRQAAATGGLADAARLPQINGAVRDTRQEFSANSNVPKPLAGNWWWLNDASVTFSYELDFWGKNAAAVEAAIGRTRASEADAQAARLLLTVGVAQAYLRLGQLYDQLDLAQATLTQREHLLELTRRRVAAQVDSQMELRQAEMALPVAREQIAALNEAIALAKGQLAALTGQGPDRAETIVRPQLITPAAVGVPATLSSDLLGRRPDLVALRWRAEALGQDIKVARAQFYPSFNLSALVGLQALGFDRLLRASSQSLAVGSGVTLPLFDGGRLRSNLGAREAEYDVAVEQYNQAVIDSVRDVVAQLTSLKWLDERVREQDLAVAAASDAYQLAVKRYQSGLGNYVQVLIAEGQVLAQRRSRIDLAARALDLDLNLIRALGGGYIQTGGADHHLNVALSTSQGVTP